MWVCSLGGLKIVKIIRERCEHDVVNLTLCRAKAILAFLSYSVVIPTGGFPNRSKTKECVAGGGGSWPATLAGPGGLPPGEAALSLDNGARRALKSKTQFGIQNC